VAAPSGLNAGGRDRSGHRADQLPEEPDRRVFPGDVDASVRAGEDEGGQRPGGRADGDVGRRGRGPCGERPVAPVAFHQVVRAVEPEVPMSLLVAAVTEINSLDDGTEQVLGMQRLARLRPAPGVLQPPQVEPVEDRPEVGSGRRQAVPDLPPAGFPVGGDDSGVLQVAQALAERLGSYPAEPVHQVGEPLGPGEEVADHQQAPPVADAFQCARDQAEVIVSTCVPGHLPKILSEGY
jgi:hypothetical protein